MTTEEADHLKRIHWAHKPDLKFKNKHGEFLPLISMGSDIVIYKDNDLYSNPNDISKAGISTVKPVLRTLDDMTDEELAMAESLAYMPIDTSWGNLDPVEIVELALSGDFTFYDFPNHFPVSYELVNYLLELGVDVCGLIDAGHAIRKGGSE